MKDFKDKIALVTGASSGIGKQIAFDLASLGCKVVLVARNKENLIKAKKEISQLKVEVMAISCDISDKSQVEAMASQVLKKFGKVDLLVNAAGYGNYKSILDSSAEEFEQMMKTNYFGTIYTIKSFLPKMKEQNSGHIVNIASIAGIVGIPNFSGYSATKWAVLGLSESLHNEFYDTNIKITAVCPGGVETNFFNDPSFDKYKKVKKPMSMLKPIQVSRATINAIRKEKFFVVVPGYGKSIRFFKSIMPNVVNKLLRKYSA